MDWIMYTILFIRKQTASAESIYRLPSVDIYDAIYGLVLWSSADVPRKK